MVICVQRGPAIGDVITSFNVDSGESARVSRPSRWDPSFDASSILDLVLSSIIGISRLRGGIQSFRGVR